MARIWPDTRPVYYGSAAERAAFPAAGEAAGALFFDYDDETLYCWDGAAWVAIGGGGIGWKLGNLIVLSASGDGDYTTVAAAFGAAGAGDTILVDEGIYTCDGETVPDEVVVVGIDPENCVFTSDASAVTLRLGSGNHVANLRIVNTHVAAASYCIEVPNTSADIPTIRNLTLRQVGHTDGFCMYVDEDVNIDTCRMFSLDGGGILVTSGGTAYVFGGKIEADPSSHAINNSAGGTVYLFGNPLLINGVSGVVKGQYVDETGVVHNLTGLDLEGVADALILDADGDTTISSPVDDQVDFEVANADQIHLVDGKLYPSVDDDVDLGDATHEFKNAYFDGEVFADLVDLGGNPDALELDADGDTTISAPTNNQIDIEIGNADEGHWTAYGLSAQNFAFRVKNTSGGVATAGDAGYIDAAGEYKTTATAYLDAAWCVVVKGGANNADIYVAQRGRVAVTLNGNCSVGDYLYTSTTAGRAQPQSYVRPELFAVALTANAAGAGGTCSALLLCQTIVRYATNPDDIYFTHFANKVSDLDWSGTIQALPGGAVVRYTTTGGTEDNLRPQATTQLAKIRLYNSTRGTYALISDNDPTGGAGYDGAITLTASVPAGWIVGDAVTIRSQVNTSTFGTTGYFIDMEIVSGVSTLARNIEMEMTILDTASANQGARVHPWEANAASKRFGSDTQVANVNNMVVVITGLIQRRFCLTWQASGAGTVVCRLKLAKEFVAAP